MLSLDTSFRSPFSFNNWCSACWKDACSELPAWPVVLLLAAFLENRSYKQFQTQQCASMGPEQYGSCIIHTHCCYQLSIKWQALLLAKFGHLGLGLLVEGCIYRLIWCLDMIFFKWCYYSNSLYWKKDSSKLVQLSSSRIILQGLKNAWYSWKKNLSLGHKWSTSYLSFGLKYRNRYLWWRNHKDDDVWGGHYCFSAHYWPCVYRTQTWNLTPVTQCSCTYEHVIYK